MAMHTFSSRPAVRAFALILGTFALAGCRGGTSTSPPVHIVPDMDFQPKLKAQATSHFPGWTDGRSMRAPVADTVARGSLPDAELLPNAQAPGKGADGAYLQKNPLSLTAASLQRGRELFDINCAICHGYSGRGGKGETAHGMVGRRWPVAIPTFHASDKAGADNRVPSLKDGEIFEVITLGKSTMPAYGTRIAVADRWAIIQYVRALQELGRQ